MTWRWAGEQPGYHSLWSNDEPGSAGLETLAHFAAAAPQLELDVGILPLDRHQPRPAHFLLTFLGAAIGLIVLWRSMARDPSWQRLAGYALTTGTAILVVIPLHSPARAPRRGAAAPVVGPVQLVGDHAVAHLHGRPCTQTPARRRGGPSTVTRDDHRT